MTPAAPRSRVLSPCRLAPRRSGASAESRPCSSGTSRKTCPCRGCSRGLRLAVARVPDREEPSPSLTARVIQRDSWIPFSDPTPDESRHPGQRPSGSDSARRRAQDRTSPRSPSCRECTGTGRHRWPRSAAAHQFDAVNLAVARRAICRSGTGGSWFPARSRGGLPGRAMNSLDSIWPARSRRLKSFHAGRMLRKSPGVGRDPYQPMPKPSALVGVSAERDDMLWSMSECFGLKRTSKRDRRAGVREPAAHGPCSFRSRPVRGSRVGRLSSRRDQ